MAALAFANAQNVSSELSQHIGISNTSASVLQEPGLNVTCVNCTVIGDLSLSGGCEFDFCHSAPDTNFSSLPFDYTDLWVGAVVEDFYAIFNLSIELAPTATTNEISVPLFAPLFPSGINLGLNIPYIKDSKLEFNFNPTLHGWINSTEPVNFTYGFEVNIPADSAIWIPLLHLDNVTTMGFANSTLKPLDFTSIDANDDFAFELSFRPIFSVSGTIFDADVGSGELFADVPKIDITVSQVSNVTSDCEPAAAGTASDLIYHNLTLVVPTLGFDFGYNISEGNTDDTNSSLLGASVTLPTACLDFLPSSLALATASTTATAKSAAIVKHESQSMVPMALLAAAVVLVSL